MPRPPLLLGAYGKIKTWQDGKTWLARAKFRDFDGVVRLVGGSYCIVEVWQGRRAVAG